MVCDRREVVEARRFGQLERLEDAPLGVGELGALYRAYAEGRSSPLADLPVQYADYARWQRDWLRESVLDRALEYWKRNLAGVSPLNLPTDRRRPAVVSDGAGLVPRPGLEPG